MRRTALMVAALVFLAALILDTAAVLRLAAHEAWGLARAHPWWLTVAVAGGAAWLAWRRWRARSRPPPRRPGGPRKGRKPTGGKTARRRRVLPE